MRLFLLSLVIIATAGAQAATYDLKDESILGLYELETANKKSEIQKVELIYNTDNKLVVVTDRNEQEYELDAPNKAGVVFEGEDEPNCGGEEEKCWFDSKTVITLKKVKVGGHEIPQLTLKITQSNAWDEEGKDDFTTTFVLNWEKELEHAIPFFVNIKNPVALDKLVKGCNRALEDIEFEDGAGYLNSNDVCPFAHSVQLREPFAKSLKAFLKSREPARGKRGIVEVTPAQLKAKVFKRARALAGKYSPKKANSPSRADVLEQIDNVEAYAAQGDVLYTYPYIRDQVIVVVDSKRKTVSHFGIKVTDKYKD